MLIFRVCLLFLTAVVFFPLEPAKAWEPTKPIEFVIPAGTGGGADQMARLISGNRREAQIISPAHYCRQQIRWRRRRGLSRRKGEERRRVHDDHHALQSLHHAPSHRGPL